MNEQRKERRVFKRFKTGAKIDFQVVYELKTEVKFQVIQKKAKKTSQKYLAYTKDISAGGVCFISAKKLDPGNILHLEVHVPGKDLPSYMSGEVTWSHPVPANKTEDNIFSTGVRITSVDGCSVYESTFYSKPCDLVWSVILETFFEKPENLKKSK